MDNKIVRKNYLTKECECLMNTLDNKIVRKNYLTKECEGLMNPKFFFKDKSKDKKDNLIFKAKQIKSISELCKRSDFISLHCPGGGNNKNIINEKSLQLMKKSTFLINTARGELIEENSLCKALNNDQIAGAGLDVYNNEPDINPKLLKAKNVVLLPHLGSATSKARNAMGFKVIENLKSYFNSGKAIDIVKHH